MSDPMRIRAAAAGGKVTVRVLVSHEMETGLRKDTAGKLVPALYIQTISAVYNGKTVMSSQWGPAVSKNPFIQFTFSDGKAGDKIAVTWADNTGDKRTDEATIS
jgi:sulfur-oxidizing protein SoxZ